MNYLAWVGFWFYGALSANQRANFFPSWGMMSDLPYPIPPATIGHGCLGLII